MQNLTDREFAEYAAPEYVKDRLHSLITRLEEAEDEVAGKRHARRIELLEEQVYFAQELIDAVESSLKDAKTLPQCRKAIAAILSNSSFDR